MSSSSNRLFKIKHSGGGERPSHGGGRGRLCGDCGIDGLWDGDAGGAEGRRADGDAVPLWGLRAGPSVSGAVFRASPYR